MNREATRNKWYIRLSEKLDIKTGQEALKNTGETEYENAQETSTLCHAISTALPKFEKHNQGQMVF